MTRITSFKFIIKKSDTFWGKYPFYKISISLCPNKITATILSQLEKSFKPSFPCQEQGKKALQMSYFISRYF